MRYLKKFENTGSKSIEELEEFCEVNLAYLVDRDFFVDIINNKPDKEYEICITNNGGFYWDEVKDYLIPFLERLLNNYTLNEYIYIYPSNNRLNSYKPYMPYIYDVISEEEIFNNMCYWDLDLSEILIKVKSMT